MIAPLTLVSLNIQRSNHLHLVLPFLARQMPDVACIQELFESDIPKLGEALGGAACLFAPMSRFVRAQPPEIMGVGIFSRYHFRDSGMSYYRGDPARLPSLDQDNPATWNNKNFPLLWCDTEKDSILYRIATTHFTWTPDGQADDDQRRDVKELLGVLAPLGPLVLTGDFNAPRGREIFSTLAQQYTDNVPTRYTTSLDMEYHRKDNLELMVDGMFSTPEYQVTDVELVSGVSDHRAITSVVTKKMLQNH